MNNQREFVQIPERQLVDVTLKFATGLKKEGQFGSYQLYTVLHDGKEKALKVSDRLEKQFRKFDVKVGDTLSLLKETITPQKGEPFTVINVIDQKKGAVSDTAHNVNGKTIAQQLLQPPAEIVMPPNLTPEGFSGDTLVMHQSLLDAVDITRLIPGVEWRNTDIEKIGVTLFLSRTGQLTAQHCLSNGNGNGNGNNKRTRRTKQTSALVGDNREHSSQVALVAAEVEGEKDDVPF